MADPETDLATCSSCGLVIIEAERKPCPQCGDTRRSLGRSADEQVGAADKA